VGTPEVGLKVKICLISFPDLNFATAELLGNCSLPTSQVFIHTSTYGPVFVSSYICLKVELNIFFCKSSHWSEIGALSFMLHYLFNLCSNYAAFMLVSSIAMELSVLISFRPKEILWCGELWAGLGWFLTRYEVF
jgi:hypothetical protein